MNVMEKIFPRAPHRIHRKDAFWNGKKKPFAIAVVASSIILQLVFFVNICYLFGSVHNTSHRVSNLNVLMIDYDGDVIGKSMLAASSSLAGDNFPGVQTKTVAEYPEPSDIYNAVYSGKYWAGIYTHANASSRLATALGGNTMAAFYNTSDVITYVWNEARYSAPSDGYLESSLEKLIQVMCIDYNHINGTGALQALNQKDNNAIQVFLTPWQSSSINIQPTSQGDRVLYNTVIMVLPIIMQFFCLMAINGISSQFRVYAHLPITDNGVLRLILSLTFTFLASLFFTIAIWAFKETWATNAGRFFCTWLIFWLYMHINFLIMDCATAFISLKFIPFFVLTWVILNVTSTIFPFELSNGFYKIGYAFPAYETWQVLIQIFSGGACGRSYQALPILFVWEVLLLPLSKIAMHRRCLKASFAEQEEERRVLERFGKSGDETRVRGMSVAETEDGSTHELRRRESKGSVSRRSGDDDGGEARAEEKKMNGDEYWPAMPVPFSESLALDGEGKKEYEGLNEAEQAEKGELNQQAIPAEEGK